MSLLRALQTALSNLGSNKLRSSLTMLGVIIGVGAVIVMVSIVEGARAQIVREFQRLGSQLILVVYQPDRKERQNATHRLDGLTMDAIGGIYQVHRITVVRWMNQARQALAKETRRELSTRLRVDHQELESIMRLIESQMEVSLRAFLG